MESTQKPVNTLLQSVFSRAVDEPSAVAIVSAEATLTYADVAQQVNVLAAALAARGVREGSWVAIKMSRCASLVPALLALWRLGAAYVPIDPTYPASRQAFILDDAGVQFCISDRTAVDQKALQHLPDSFTDNVLIVEEALESASQLPLQLPELTLCDQAAYVIYTSGSTGNPKGVEIRHSNAANFICSMARRPGMNREDTLLAVTTISFDIHVLELFLPLWVGAKLVMATAEQARSASQLRHLLNRYQVSVMQATPATWRMLLSDGWRPDRAFKLLVGGEALPADLLPHMHCAASEVWNMYGPTETTVWSTCAKLCETDRFVALGEPIDNTTVYIVDEQDQLVADGAEGELLIGGEGVSPGYHNRDDLTESRFVTLPHITSERLYKTGDLVVRQNGLLKYIDRLDNQIKIRGFRVEPGDIEVVIKRHADIEECAVVAAELALGDVRLAAFCVLRKGALLPQVALRQQCKEHMPAYMVPQHFIALDEMPLTANLKLDRKALKAILVEQREQLSAQDKRNGEPRNDLDRSLIAVWEDALGVANIGIDDDFFALGGHSLLLLSMLEQVRKATGHEFGMADVFSRPTIRALVSEGHALSSASVVPLNQACGEDKPLQVFCLCGVAIYKTLAEQMSPLPVFGVFAEQEVALVKAAEQGGHFEFSIPQLVDVYTQAILRQGNVTEVILVGLSFGGFLCAAVAAALEQKGVKVKGLALLDAYLPGCVGRSKRKLSLDIAKRIAERGVKASLYSSAKRVQRWFRKRVNKPVLFDERARGRAFDEVSEKASMGDVQLHMPILLVKARCTDFGLGMVALHDYGWGPFAKGGLEIAHVDADHIGLMKGQPANTVAKQIRHFLQHQVGVTI